MTVSKLHRENQALCAPIWLCSFSQASLQKAQGPGVCKLPKPPASRALCQAKRAPIHCTEPSGVPRGPSQLHSIPDFSEAPLDLPEITGTSRGNQGFPAPTRKRPRESFFNPQRPAGSTHSSTRGRRPPEQLERPAGFPSSLGPSQ